MEKINNCVCVVHEAIIGSEPFELGKLKFQLTSIPFQLLVAFGKKNIDFNFIYDKKHLLLYDVIPKETRSVEKLAEIEFISNKSLIEITREYANATRGYPFINGNVGYYGFQTVSFPINAKSRILCGLELKLQEFGELVKTKYWDEKLEKEIEFFKLLLRNGRFSDAELLSEYGIKSYLEKSLQK